jgi:hypothetical protein
MRFSLGGCGSTINRHEIIRIATAQNVAVLLILLIVESVKPQGYIIYL